MSIEHAIRDVEDFHRVTDTPIATVPAFPGQERIDLRVDLIVEEVVKELLTAIRTRDMVGVSNGITDGIYVLIGAAHELGVPLADEWDAVQRSNMAKAVLQPDGSLKVVRRPDGKILKPEGWTPPDTEGILRAHGWKGHAVRPRTLWRSTSVKRSKSCDNCSQLESAHEWICACGTPRAWRPEGVLPLPCSKCGHGNATLYCPPSPVCKLAAPPPAL